MSVVDRILADVEYVRARGGNVARATVSSDEWARLLCDPKLVMSIRDCGPSFVCGVRVSEDPKLPPDTIAIQYGTEAE